MTESTRKQRDNSLSYVALEKVVLQHGNEDLNRLDELPPGITMGQSSGAVSESGRGGRPGPAHVHNSPSGLCGRE